ncbi:cytochrome oxidase maturation protein, cbb3-type [Lutibacter oricola]|uniref:Cytochrome oxidase maturation protein, cbb3-type n=1 Tax=Lutibacter oricola TaxID=762486 RepID=A0A1H2VVQ2_9FLAO|nr:cbb3-type cytochrome oxidase assembly protein CcoS [Lutibacter oricola]SDW72024.1 cytochrome oxidase maturation protein, cbb3-type [Lutibacter oricola]
MEVVYITIGVSIIVAVFFFIVFLKSVKSGQYEDTYTPSVRMLFDDELVKDEKEGSKEPEKAKENQQTNNKN